MENPENMLDAPGNAMGNFENALDTLRNAMETSKIR